MSCWLQHHLGIRGLACFPYIPHLLAWKTLNLPTVDQHRDQSEILSRSTILALHYVFKQTIDCISIMHLTHFCPKPLAMLSNESFYLLSANQSHDLCIARIVPVELETTRVDTFFLGWMVPGIHDHRSMQCYFNQVQVGIKSCKYIARNLLELLPVLPVISHFILRQLEKAADL